MTARPPAFPEPRGGGCTPGMSLRDYFAGQALAGLCANPGGPFQSSERSGWEMVNCMPGDLANECYRLADALMAKVEK